jgi:hypothetical protein
MLTFGRRKLRAEGAGTWECIRVTLLLNTVLHPRPDFVSSRTSSLPNGQISQSDWTMPRMATEDRQRHG